MNTMTLLRASVKSKTSAKDHLESITARQASKMISNKSYTPSHPKSIQRHSENPNPSK